MATSSPVQERRTQAERSAETKGRLIDAAIGCLVEHGYAHTTAVVLCQRAGLTRGALHHHFPDLADLFIGVLERIYLRLAKPDDEPAPASIEEAMRAAWGRASHPDFKAVIEIWLAARNDPDFGKRLHPAIARLSQLFSPSLNPGLAKRLGDSPEQLAFYRLSFEAMIGLALGRATSPGGAPVEHESEVIETLVALGRQLERQIHPARND